MRYTTLIDITEDRALYANHNARLLYLHLALKAGYHDDDRDLVRMSLRSMVVDVGLTLAAVRHAIKVLQAHGLLSRQGDLWHVRKYVASQDITPRAKTIREQRRIDAAKERAAAEERRHLEAQLERAQREKLEMDGKTPYMVYYERQMILAKAGDKDAQKIVERNRDVYESHKRAMVTRKVNDSTNKMKTV